MILPVTANLKEIEEKGRNYQWVRPEVCVRCRHYSISFQYSNILSGA
ncbi:MAG: hypothetical protein ABIN18_02185 [Pseudomonadota bacterium]